MNPGGGQPNMQQLMKQAQQMQRDLAAAQDELAAAQVEGTAGGGLVTATVTGTGEVVGVTIDPSVVDPDDVETLEDLVVAAINDGTRGPASCRRRRWARSPAAWAPASACRAWAEKDVRRARPGSHRRARPAARRRSEERPAHRVPPCLPPTRSTYAVWSRR